jgi:hypothetical protein
MYYIEDDEIKEIDVTDKDTYLTYGIQDSKLIIIQNKTTLYTSKQLAKNALRIKRYSKLRQMFREYNEHAKSLSLGQEVDFVYRNERVQGMVTDVQQTYYVITDSLGKEHYVDKIFE